MPTFPRCRAPWGSCRMETRRQRTAELNEIADFAKLLGVDAVGVHIGFVPHDARSADYREILAIARDVCDHLAANRQALHLETGQEPADVLLRFLEDVERDNLFVNFDPANMILYGVGEPLPASADARPLCAQHSLQGRHLVRSPWRNVGPRSAAGRGRTSTFAAYLRTLAEIGYDGPLTIEREIPQEPERQKAEIAAAVKLLERLRAEVGH